MTTRESREGRFTPVGKILHRYLDSSGLGESIERLGAIDEWAKVVGPRVSGVTRAVAVRGDELVVEVLSSAWIAELSMMRGLILERLNSTRDGPPVGGIRFRLAETAQAIGSSGDGH